MRILYDHDIFSMQPYGGISRSFISLIDQFVYKKEIQVLLPIFFTNNIYLLDRDYYRKFDFIPGKRFFFKTFLLRKMNHFPTQLAIIRNKYDIYHQTFYNTKYLYPFKKKPMVITVHDLTPEILPQYFGHPEKIHRGKRKLCEQADAIVAVSKNTKLDLVRKFDVPEEKIEVIYHGVPKFTIKKKTGWLSVIDKYILFVGYRGGYKNFSTAAVAAAQIMKKDRALHFVALGGEKVQIEELIPFRHMDCMDRFHHISPPDSEMGMYYSNAAVLVFPSLYEGFGLPIMEAFSCRCPVVLSKGSCFPEIAEDSGLYFDALDPDSLKEALSRVLYDSSLREKLIEKGAVRARDFTWEKAANQLVDLYGRLL